MSCGLGDSRAHSGLFTLISLQAAESKPPSKPVKKESKKEKKEMSLLDLDDCECSYLRRIFALEESIEATSVN